MSEPSKAAMGFTKTLDILLSGHAGTFTSNDLITQEFDRAMEVERETSINLLAFAQHLPRCLVGPHSSVCTCGYNQARQAYRKARGEVQSE